MLGLACVSAPAAPRATVPSGASPATRPAVSDTLVVFVRRFDQHCGGAVYEPGPRHGHLLADAVISVYAGERAEGTPVATARSDAEGVVRFALPAGTWCLQSAAHRSFVYEAAPRTTAPRGALPVLDTEFETDERCLATWPTQCDLVVHTPQREAHYLAPPVRPCFTQHPCVRYTGPPPP